MVSAKERYENFIKNGLTPFFKSKGFKKKGKKFIFYGDDLAYIFYPFQGKFNTRDYITFSIYVDIFMRNFEEKENIKAFISFLLQWEIMDIAKIPEYHTVMLETQDINANEKDKKMQEFFLDALESKVLPYILQITCVQDIIKLIESTPPKEQTWNAPVRGTQTVRDLALYYWILGQKQQAIGTLNKGISSINDIVREPQFRESAIRKLEETKKRILNGPDYYVRKSLDSLI